MTEEEYLALEYIEQGHILAVDHLNISDEEAIKITKTNGDIPEAAMKAYCDNHNTPYPFWIK